MSGQPAGRDTRDPKGLRVLVVRTDSDGDVLMTGPAVLAMGTGPDGVPAARVELLAAPAGAAAARLLPGVDEVIVADVPWSGYAPAAPDPAALTALVEQLRGRSYDEVVVLTSYHQSPLPLALLARLAGVTRVVGACEDYPGSLLDVRHRRPGAPDGTGGEHEVLANLALVAASGRAVPAREDVRLSLRPDLAPLPADLAAEVDAAVSSVPSVSGARDGYVVLHPGASVPARAPAVRVAAATAAALAEDGWTVVVTGGPSETALAAEVAAAAPGALDLSGRTDLEGLAVLLAGARAVVVGNTGPAHLAAAVGTPVACWFSAVMPPERWAPFGVPTVLLGDLDDLGAPCRLTRARLCPVAGHPCLDVDPALVVSAVADLVAGRGCGTRVAPAGTLTGTAA